MYRVGVCGCFAHGEDAFDGQKTKTRTVTREIENQIGQEEVITVDTMYWKKMMVKTIWECFKMAKTCKNIIILPAKNGLVVLLPLFVKLSKLFKNKVHYCVVGGWLPEFLAERPKLLNYAKEIDGIHVETFNMLNNLEKLGLENVFYLPVFKHQMILIKEELFIDYREPYCFCTFSRVTKAKGIGEAIQAVKAVNESKGRIVCTLDIYGMIDLNYEEEFKRIVEECPDYISYKGIMSDGKIVDILSKYYCLLFPTYYPGEGFPATLLDCMMAGLPTIISDWRYNSEIVKHGKTGLVYSLDNIQNLIDAVEFIVSNPDEVNKMKFNCIEEAKAYSAESVMVNLMGRLA